MSYQTFAQPTILRASVPVVDCDFMSSQEKEILTKGVLVLVLLVHINKAVSLQTLIHPIPYTFSFAFQNAVVSFEDMHINRFTCPTRFETNHRKK